MSKETKIGILTVVALALSFWGYKFIRGKNILSSTNIFYVEYAEIDQLSLSEPVLINGFQVGFVANIFLKPTDHQLIVVTLDLRKDISIPKNTVAQIIPTGFMGGKAIKLIYDTPCSGEDCAKSGDYLQGDIIGFLGSYIGEDNMEKYVNILKDGLKEVIATLNEELGKEGDSPLGKSLRDLQATIANLNRLTGQLTALLNSSSGNIAGTLDNLESITDNLETSNSKISSILSNADTFSTQLSEVNVAQTIEEVKETLSNLQGTLGAASQALEEVTAVAGSIRQGEGTLGKLMMDEQLYNSLNQLSYRTDSLLNDLQERPYRYMPFKSRKKVKRFDRQDANNN